MGCCISVRISKISSFQSFPGFSNNADNANSESRILIVGTSNSGKSTLYRQMQIINTAGFSREERKMYKDIIIDNINDCLSLILDQMEGLIKPEAINMVEEFLLISSADKWELSSSEKARILRLSQELWQLPSVKNSFKEHRSMLECPESIEFLLNELDDIAKENSLPTNQQILHCRLKTTGVREMNFVYDNGIIRMIDVGGQRSERRKWLFLFDDIEVLLFCVAVDEYDMVLREDGGTNALEESLAVFRSLINSCWFKSTTIVIFMNKIDLLEKKIKQSNVKDTFADFTGDPHCSVDVIEFIKQKYLKCDKQENRRIFSFPTCATDTDNISRVSRVCFDSVLNRHLAMTGLE